MADPNLLSLRDSLGIIAAGVLSAVAGWFAKHFKDQGKSVEMPRRVMQQIGEIHSGLLAPDPELKLNHLQQTRTVFQFMTEQDEDGVRVSWLRRILVNMDSVSKSVASSNAQIASALQILVQGVNRLDERVESLEDTWTGHPNRRRDPSRRKGPEE